MPYCSSLLLAIDIAAKDVLFTNKMEYGPCRQYNTWVWFEQQIVSPVTAKEDKGKAVLVVDIAAEHAVHY